MEFPETLYVTEQPEPFLYTVKRRVGSDHLEGLLPNETETKIGVYRLIRTNTYKKHVKTEVTVQATDDTCLCAGVGCNSCCPRT